jgi:hypothetical protein
LKTLQEKGITIKSFREEQPMNFVNQILEYIAYKEILAALLSPDYQQTFRSFRERNVEKEMEFEDF